MSNNLIDLSVVYQRRLERQLAGFALAHPVEALSIYREIKEIMIDDLAISFFEKLIKHENELQELCIDDQISLVYSIAIEVDLHARTPRATHYTANREAHVTPVVLTGEAVARLIARAGIAVPRPILLSYITLV